MDPPHYALHMIRVLDSMTTVMLMIHAIAFWALVTAGMTRRALPIALTAPLHPVITACFQLVTTGEYKISALVTVADHIPETLAIAGAATVISAIAAAERPMSHAAFWLVGTVALAAVALTANTLTGNIAGWTLAAVTGPRAILITCHLRRELRAGNSPGDYAQRYLATGAGADAAMTATGLTAILT